MGLGFQPGNNLLVLPFYVNKYYNATINCLNPTVLQVCSVGFRFPLLIKINRGHIRHVRSVKFLHVLFSYTRIYITFNSTSPASYFSFTVSLFVCVPSSETAKGKLKSCFYCSSKFIPVYLFKIHSD